jgi:hypothetical protein
LFFHTGDAAAADGSPVRFETVNPFLGLWSDKALLRDYQVFGDRESFQEYYGDTAPEVPRVAAMDFERNYLVAIHQGLCPTGGYSILVPAVKARLDTVTVTVEFQEPGPDDIVTMAMTTPHLFLLVPHRRGVQHPAFRFRSKEGALLAERRPIYGKAAPA